MRVNSIQSFNFSKRGNINNSKHTPCVSFTSNPQDKEEKESFIYKILSKYPIFDAQSRSVNSSISEVSSGVHKYERLINKNLKKAGNVLMQGKRKNYYPIRYTDADNEQVSFTFGDINPKTKAPSKLSGYKFSKNGLENICEIYYGENGNITGTIYQENMVVQFEKQNKFFTRIESFDKKDNTLLEITKTQNSMHYRESQKNGDTLNTSIEFYVSDDENEKSYFKGVATNGEYCSYVLSDDGFWDDSVE